MIPEYKVAIYRTTTLGGRPFAVLNELRQALNYQDQGTGADILILAIASLPDEIAEMLLFPVHDELVFEVPANYIEKVNRTVVETMVRAANQVLGDQIPILVESSVADVWS